MNQSESLQNTTTPNISNGPTTLTTPKLEKTLGGWRYGPLKGNGSIWDYIYMSNEAMEDVRNWGIEDEV